MDIQSVAWYVCSNHFINGKPTLQNPVPTLFTCGPENAATPTKSLRKPPTKRQKLELNEQKPSCSREIDPVPVDIEPDSDIEDDPLSKVVQTESNMIPMTFTNLTLSLIHI